MSAQPTPALTLDLPSLAQQVQDWRGYPSSDQAINELLRDVRQWRKLPLPEIEQRLATDPLAVLAGWELTLGSELALHTPSDIEFTRLFTDPAILRRMVYAAAPVEPFRLPQALSFAGGVLPGLLFLRALLRWAQRFAGWTPLDVPALRRATVRHPFAAAFAAPQPEPELAFLLAQLSELGVAVEPIPTDVPRSGLAAWLAELLALRAPACEVELLEGEYFETGGTRNSLFIVRAIGGVDGVDVRGLIGPDLGLIIDIGDREVSVASTAHLERHVVSVLNERTPLSAALEGDGLRLRWRDGRLEAADLGRIIHDALKSEFILGTISVNLIFDPLRIASLRPGIYSYREDRDTQLRKRTEDNSPLIACRACSSYAPHAFCLVSPDRPPCCGRTYDEMAMLAQLTPTLQQLVVERGITQDRGRGRYVGVDKAAALFSDGRVRRLHLHGLRDSPHPATAIPQCIAYVLDELDIACVVSADYGGRTPDGKTYDTLLTRMAGRQLPGFVGVGEAYVLSPRFLAGEGGLARVGWMNSALKSRLKIRAEQILTENECTNMAGLKEHAAAWRRT